MAITTGQDSLARNFGFSSLIAVALWFIAMLWALRPNVPGGTREAWLAHKLCDAGSSTLPFVLWMAIGYVEPVDPALLPVLLTSLRGLIDDLVGGSVIGWIVLDVAAVFACLKVLGWRIERIETPKQRLWGWTRKPMSAF